MSRYLGRLLAVLLIASPLASASIINTPAESVLNRSVNDSEPSPEFGNKYHFVAGPELIVYPRAVQEAGASELFSMWTVSIGFGIACLTLIPRIQRALLLARLLD